MVGGGGGVVVQDSNDYVVKRMNEKNQIHIFMQVVQSFKVAPYKLTLTLVNNF